MIAPSLGHNFRSTEFNCGFTLFSIFASICFVDEFTILIYSLVLLHNSSKYFGNVVQFKFANLCNVLPVDFRHVLICHEVKSSQYM